MRRDRRGKLMYMKKEPAQRKYADQNYEEENYTGINYTNRGHIGKVYSSENRVKKQETSNG